MAHQSVEELRERTAEEEKKARERLDRRQEEFMRKKEQQSKSLVLMGVFFIIVLSVLFSFDWTTSPPRFNPIILLVGIFIAVVVYLAVEIGPQAANRARIAAQRSQDILDSINLNLVKLGQLEDRMTRFEIRLSRLEQSRGLVPPP